MNLLETSESLSKIYDKAIDAVRSTPSDRRVAMIVRHSVRYPIVDEASILTAALTPEGVALAEEMGEKLANIRKVRTITTNFIGRCVDTAHAMSRGAGHRDGVVQDRRLSHPYIEPAWNALPIAWPQNPAPEELLGVLNMVFATEDTPGVLDIYVTHDTIVGVAAGYLMDEVFSQENWPNYLEGIVLWQDRNELCALWRGEIRRFDGLKFLFSKS